MALVVSCVQSPDGLPVDPCGTVGGIAMQPQLINLPGAQPLDYSGLNALFAWVLGFVLVVFAVGITVGAIMRVIRSA